MNMQEHILTALRELFDRWEALLAGMSEAQFNTPLTTSHWTIKDVIVHLWAWQQRSIARMEAALSERTPEFPSWFPQIDTNVEGATDRINTQIYDLFRDKSWSSVYQSWREGFLHLLEIGEAFTEQNLLDPSRYPWLERHSLAFILVSSYDHHQEHLERLIARLNSL